MRVHKMKNTPRNKTLEKCNLIRFATFVLCNVYTGEKI